MSTNKLQLRLQAQIVEMKSDLNRHAARVKFGKADQELTSNDLAVVYNDSQRTVEMGKLFSEETYAAAAVRIGRNPEELNPLECLKALWETFSPNHPDIAPPLLLSEESQTSLE